MKVILVFDKPNCCYDCPCYYEDKDKCEVFNKRAIADIGIPSWCPLRPLDYKVGALGSVINPQGYTLSNADELLAEILGEQNGEEKLL